MLMMLAIMTDYDADVDATAAADIDG